ncbi:N-acetylmuramoyl-L-alanine amidase [Flexibacterium corallicola]|uniref:N-acetylmuramoyl-L-alanine amidase n=1 Tax=Flexibacterium corallicola TaxID=3037259 RepID=UPI00286ED19F|nr:N-acetylmuramoyl-L-alanine amidase [Pseudovibrio sp. M1P-2-3]
MIQHWKFQKLHSAVTQYIALTLLTLLLAQAGWAKSSFAAGQDVLEVTSGTVKMEGERTRFTMETNGDVNYRVSFLANPYRIIVDLPELRFQVDPDRSTKGEGLIDSWRYGQISKGKSRIVLDLNHPAIVEKLSFLPEQEGRSARLVMELLDTSHDLFVDQSPLSGIRVPVPVAADRSAQEVPKEQTAANRPVIVIDPGHGGIDAGATGIKGTLEKDVVLEFARHLKAKLEEQGLFTVHLTREEDLFIPLRGRRQIGHELKADLFISVHADSVRSGAEITRGASVYTLSERASDAMAAALADRENRSDVLAGIDLSEEPAEVSDILVELSRRETKNFSIHFARLAVEELKSATQVINNPLRAAGFQVLRSPDVPSVLVEVGFLSNQEDEKQLGSKEWRERASDALVQAVLRYFRGRIASTSGD